MDFSRFVIDGIDLETTLLAESEDQARELGLSLMKSLGFKDVDVVFVEHNGFAARIRLRAYVYRPGDKYQWFEGEDLR
ncbi:hypothetical protein [Pseudothermotoga thermarum]|uniref:Uncharacterized protein n=1 Tax=Pseudothermotoga thermarum DSM 5069 TaxID=688269 RepID=F7YTU9_9THEM|nr:hypothetical protein [Pseudothermotoga thermarum]AEH51394.1 hypothetical protein Theth_1330 [Pseudothermotoga thermarum DSM 5069]